MGLSYYTIDDLRQPPRQASREGWSIEHFPVLEPALDHYRRLTCSGAKALGLTDGVHVLELVEHLSLRPEGRDGEDVLASDYRREPFWAQVPEAANATERCIAALGLRYAVDGNVLVPIPSFSGLSEALQGKYLWLDVDGGDLSAIHRVYVEGMGWTSPGILDRPASPMPLVLKYQVVAIDEQGAYHSLEVEPWEHGLLLLRTRERLEQERGKGP